MFVLTVAALLVALVGVSLQNAQLRRDLKKETQYKKNATDHGYATSCLMAMGRRWITRGPGGNQGAVFDFIFPDQDLVRRISIYIGARNYAGDFIPHQLTADQLENPECCRTVADIISMVERARHEQWATQLNLPKPTSGQGRR